MKTRMKRFGITPFTATATDIAIATTALTSTVTFTATVTSSATDKGAATVTATITDAVKQIYKYHFVNNNHNN